MSVKIYPVQETELRHDAYQVKINGTPVVLDTARVSAIPYNRRWPGHQRPLDQTELVNFLSLAADEPVTFEITPKDPFEMVTIRPQSLNLKPAVSQDGTIVVTLNEPAYFTVEPYGRRNALHIFVDPMPSYQIQRQNENTIYFGAGIHEAGEITLKSHQTLFLEEGAVVYGCVKAMDAEKIRICGRGILDNSHNKEKILYEVNAQENTAAIDNAIREHTIQLEYCTDVEIDGITIRDSLVYNVRPIGCKNLHIHNLKIIGCWRYNSDGIDMHNCENVLIENCFLRTFDDSICVKGFDCYYPGDVEKAVKEAMYRNGKQYDIFKNVRVKNCTIWNDWGKCLEIGAETRAREIADVVFENCNIIHVTSQVLDCCNVDYADVYNICFKNINIELDEIIPEPKLQAYDDEPYQSDKLDYVPTIIEASVLFHAEYSAGGTKRGRNRKLLYDTISIVGKRCPEFVFSGVDPEHCTSDVTIRKFLVNGAPIVDKNDFIVKIDEFCKNIKVEY